MSKIRVTQNGTEVKWFEQRKEVMAFIKGEMEKYPELQPKLIFERVRDPELSVYIYQYKTLYQEIFTVQYV